jgi:hypothetical protein
LPDDRPVFAGANHLMAGPFRMIATAFESGVLKVGFFVERDLRNAAQPLHETTSPRIDAAALERFTN